MEVTVEKFGDGLGFKLPASVVSDLNVSCGDMITLKPMADGVEIRKTRRDPWAEMEAYFGKSISEITEEDLYRDDVEIVDFGPDVGNEVIE